MADNPFLLAADNKPALLPLLRANPALASGQDEHGYSLVHAAASYNHLDLLRTLVHEFNVNVDLRDEDDETALFVVETVEAAKVLVEELGADVLARGSNGLTAQQKILEEDDFPPVAEYLKGKEADLAGNQANGSSVNGVNGNAAGQEALELPPAPEGMAVSMSTIAPGEDADIGEIDTELRRRIEELAEREDFHTDEGQAELRRLVQDALGDGSLGERNVRQRQE